MLDSIATKTHLAGRAAHLAVLPPRSRALVHELYVVGSTADMAGTRLGISRATLHRHHAELARIVDRNKASPATRDPHSTPSDRGAYTSRSLSKVTSTRRMEGHVLPVPSSTRRMDSDVLPVPSLTRPDRSPTFDG